MRTNFRMEDKNITMIRGDTLAFAVELYDENGERFTDEINRASFSCKSNKKDDIYLFRRVLGQGIEKVENGVYRVRVSPNNTKDVEAGKYFYDLQIGVGADVFTIMHGVLEIEQDVTIDTEEYPDDDAYFEEATFADIDNIFK